jgi:hypothetical protein
LIGIESKRYEPFRPKNGDEMSDAYWRAVWGTEMKGYQGCRDGLRDGSRQFGRLDAAQLIKHIVLLTARLLLARWHAGRPS